MQEKLQKILSFSSKIIPNVDRIELRIGESTQYIALYNIY